MIKKQAGFTMTELLITMVIFMFAIIAMSNVFVPLLTQFKQQSRVAETQIEGAVGLQILRKDLEQAGFGLPWVLPAAVAFNEGSDTVQGWIPLANNASINDATTNPPRAIASINNVGGLVGSDYLVIKATSIATHDAAMKWTHVIGGAGVTNTVNIWGNSTDDLEERDLAIVLIPSRGGENQRILVISGGTFYIMFPDSPTNFPAGFAPSTQNDVYLVYGVISHATGVTSMRMPFNRADYYIDRGTTTTIPPRCAPGSGVLMKTLISHEADGDRLPGDRLPGTPLLDCVADMQVIFRLDTNDDGTIDSTKDVLNDDLGSPLTARELREQLKEVRVYILAHEGQMDRSYTHCVNPPACSANSILIGEFGLGRNFNLTAITDWQHYRWKVYTIAVKPNNLRS